MNDNESLSGEARSLFEMMDFGTGQQTLWDTEELEAILQHQLDAPLEQDLATIDRSVPSQFAGWNADSEKPLRSFRDLFQHPHPPVELLELTKRFAKRSRSDPESPFPAQISTVLYYLAIAAAMTRCNRPISELNAEGLHLGFAWALKRTWLDSSMRDLLVEADAAAS